LLGSCEQESCNLSTLSSFHHTQLAKLQMNYGYFEICNKLLWTIVCLLFYRTLWNNSFYWTVFWFPLFTLFLSSSLDFFISNDQCSTLYFYEIYFSIQKWMRTYSSCYSLPGKWIKYRKILPQCNKCMWQSHNQHHTAQAKPEIIW
jgi:hypothetical protein